MNEKLRNLEARAALHVEAASHLLKGLQLAPMVGTVVERAAAFRVARRELSEAIDAIDLLEIERNRS